MNTSFQNSFAYSVYKQKYAHPEEEWEDTAARVVKFPMNALYYTNGARRGRVDIQGESDKLYDLIATKKFLPGGRYLYAAGNDLHQVQNCLLLDVEDSREGWADLAYKVAMSLMTGAGVGVYYGKLRGSGELIKRTGGVSTGPVPLMISINEQGRAYVQGGNRRAALWAGLLWSHPDIESFIRAKDWPQWLREQKAKDVMTPAPLDMTNISVCLDDEFFAAYHDLNHPLHAKAQSIYWLTVKKMVMTGEPGFSIDLGDKSDEKLRNACTEIVSADDSDICNLGGVVLSRFDTPEEFGEAVRSGVLYLTSGSLYSDVPYKKVDEVRSKNRRLGLDLLGVHEFLLQRGVRYGSDEAFEALEPYMEEYDRALDYATDWQDKLGISHSVAATSGAPTGTRGIIAETTTGWEPVSAVAYKRRLRHSTGKGDRISYQYVVDPTVNRLIEDGIIDAHDQIDDAYSLAYDVEKRFKMQAYAQSHIDQAVSMTINLPYQITDERERKDFGELLLNYLPKFRGITVYPNGARDGQPIEPVSLEHALDQQDVVFWEDEEKCASGLCGV